MLEALLNKKLDQKHCFLCDNLLNKSNYTDEHIFPKWLLRKYNLWKQTLNFPNGEATQYDEIRIPCCDKCNNILSKLERIIKTASDVGYKTFVKLSEQIIYLWLIKIFYELLYLDLKYSTTSNDIQRINTDKGVLENYRMCLLTLNSVKTKTMFTKPYPWSIFIFNLQQYNDKNKNFDYKDNIPTLSIAIRMGDIGIIACLQDNNTQERMFGNYFKKIRKILLHPVQFIELISKIFYKEQLRNRIPDYIVVEGKEGVEVISIPLGGLSNKPIYNTWKQKDYAKILGQYLKRDYKDLYVPPNKVYSWLYNEKGKLNELDIKNWDPMVY